MISFVRCVVGYICITSTITSLTVVARPTLHVVAAHCIAVIASFNCAQMPHIKPITLNSLNLSKGRDVIWLHMAIQV